jgi:hypothetical protein
MLRVVLAALLIGSPLASRAEGTIQIAVKLTPAGSFVAKSERLKGDLTRTGGDITSTKLSVALDSFKTGMALRDEHFCKHLGCEAQPKAVLTDMKASGGKGSGLLELNGVKKDISFQYEEKDSNFVAKFDLNSTEFKMAKAKYLGIEVAETVSVEVRVPAPKK